MPERHPTVNEELLSAYLSAQRPALRIYEPPETVIVMGAGRRPEQDIHLAQAERDGVPVLRRRGGGGTVVLSPGQVVLALVTEVDNPFQNREYFRAVNDWFREALGALGVEGVEDRGICDLAIGGRKILGASLYRRRGVLFYQGSLLVDNDLSLFSRYLTFPSIVPDYRRGRGHEEFCTTLAREGHSLTAARVIGALSAVAARRLALLR